MRYAIASTILLLFLSSTCPGYLVRSWSWQELYDEADLVLIGKVTAAKQSGEKLDTGTDDGDRLVLTLAVTMETELILKGELKERQLVMRVLQLRQPLAPVSTIGALGVFFADIPVGESRLVFLKRNSKGELEPVTGHVEAGRSITPVQNPGFLHIEKPDQN